MIPEQLWEDIELEREYWDYWNQYVIDIEKLKEILEKYFEDDTPY